MAAKHLMGCFVHQCPLVLKISDQSGKLLETHHLVYSGLLSWRLGEGVWKLEVVIDDSSQTNVLLVRS